MYADNEPIGFTAWRGELQWAIVDYKWLHPDYRGQATSGLKSMRTHLASNAR